jgi:hypothetical protein
MAKCACCNRDLKVDDPDQQKAAREEYERYFGRFRREDVAVVCDECFQKMHPENNPHAVEEAMAQRDIEVLTRDDDQE